MRQSFVSPGTPSQKTVLREESSSLETTKVILRIVLLYRRLFFSFFVCLFFWSSYRMTTSNLFVKYIEQTSFLPWVRSKPQSWSNQRSTPFKCLKKIRPQHTTPFTRSCLHSIPNSYPLMFAVNDPSMSDVWSPGTFFPWTVLVHTGLYKSSLLLLSFTEWWRMFLVGFMPPWSFLCTFLP